jgi:hypothetical protein
MRDGDAARDPDPEANRDGAADPDASRQADSGGD